MSITRAWAMPNKNTFSISPIGDLVQKYLSRSVCSIDPFARNKEWATHTNDINPKTKAQHHLDAREFLKQIADKGIRCDLVLFDPPYSPRQIAECYHESGLTPSMRDTQTGSFMKECKALIDEIANPDCFVLSFGWNSVGMGRRWKRIETLLVCHGGVHNDTICVVDQLGESQERLF